MSDLIKELGVEVQKNIAILNAMSMQNTSGMSFVELALMRAARNAAYANLRESEKLLQRAVDNETTK